MAGLQRRRFRDHVGVALLVIDILSSPETEPHGTAAIDTATPAGRTD